MRRTRSCGCPSPYCGGSGCGGSSAETKKTCCPVNGGWTGAGRVRGVSPFSTPAPVLSTPPRPRRRPSCGAWKTGAAGTARVRSRAHVHCAKLVHVDWAAGPGGCVGGCEAGRRAALQPARALKLPFVCARLRGCARAAAPADWSSWTEWTPKDANANRKCNIEQTRSRTRKCEKPKPSCAGNKCSGADKEAPTRDATYNCCSEQYFPSGASSCSTCAAKCKAVSIRRTHWAVAGPPNNYSPQLQSTALSRPTTIATTHARRCWGKVLGVRLTLCPRFFQNPLSPLRAPGTAPQPRTGGHHGDCAVRARQGGQRRQAQQEVHQPGVQRHHAAQAPPLRQHHLPVQPQVRTLQMPHAPTFQKPHTYTYIRIRSYTNIYKVYA